MNPSLPTLTTPADAATESHVAIYLRVSTDEQDVDHQRADCYTAAEREFPGLPTIEYVDQGISASKHDMADRDAAARLIAGVAAGDVGGIVTWKQDRLSRRGPAEIGYFLDHCSQHGVRIVSATEGELHQADVGGEIVASIRGVMAKYESITKGERSKSGQIALARAGKWPKGPTPRGYDRDSETKKLIENETAFYVREAFDRFDTGHSRNALARWLTDTTDMTWTRLNVTDMLKNPAYIGFIKHAGERHPGLHEPLVSADLFERVQDRLFETKGLALRENRRSPFGAMLRCECGEQLHYHAEPRLGHANYECRNCGHRLHAECIEFAYYLLMHGITGHISERMADPDWRTDDDTGEEASLRDELTDITKQRANLLRLVARGDTMAENMADDLRKRTESIERTLRRLTASWETKRELLTAMVEAWDGFDWPTATVEERRLRVTASTESLRIEHHEDEDWQSPEGATVPLLVVRPRGFPTSICASAVHTRRGDPQRHLRNLGIGVSVPSPS